MYEGWKREILGTYKNYKINNGDVGLSDIFIGSGG